MQHAHTAVERGKTLGRVGFDEADGVFNGQNLLGGIVRDFATEFLFEGHHKLNGIKTVSP